MKNKKIINICIFMVIICFALSGCNDNKNKNENVATSTDTEISEEVTTEKADKNTTETTTNKVTTEESKTTEKEAAKDKTTATTTETSKPQTTQTPATTQATTEAPKPQTTQAPVTTQATTEAPKPQTTQAPATTQTTTEAPATTEHQHTWESVGHTETVYVRSDTGAQVSSSNGFYWVNGQDCIITGYNSGYECGVCGYKCSSGQEIDDHVWGVHNGEANTKDWQEPIYVSVTQKSVYVEDYQRCSICGATK